MNRTSLATCTLAGLIALDIGGATAGEPLPPGVPNWTGFYFGGAAGFTRQSIDYDNLFFNGDTSLNGFYGGGFGGYNYHFTPQFLIGGEVGLGFTSLDRTAQIGGFDLRSHTPWEGHAVFRFGYLIAPQKLVYVGAGAAFGKQEVSFPNLSESFTRVGYTVRAGVEFGQLINGLHMGFEYSFTDFGEKTYFGDLHVGLDQHAFMIRIATTPTKAGFLP
jgi:opacity protein-like surface antigen